MSQEELIARLAKLATAKVEKRTKRMQILVTPSKYDALKALAEEYEISMNELVNVALEDLLQANERVAPMVELSEDEYSVNEDE